MTADRSVLAIHGIWNLRPGLARRQAAAELARAWQPRLRAGYQNAGLSHLRPPTLAAAYYADLLASGAQGADVMTRNLTPNEQRFAWRWLAELGVPTGTAQGPATTPLRQGLDWLARRDGREARLLARLMTTILDEVYAYLTRPPLRQRVRAVVAEAIETHRPRIILAHSLGSIIAYEALHASGTEVDLLVTLGSPLGLPGAVFEALDPEPIARKGRRPAGVRRWVNIADPGDLVAVPKRLGDRFPVDLHEEAYLGKVNFHTLGGYLSCGLVATAVAPYVSSY